MNKIEKERKFLLKRMPHQKADVILCISQKYHDGYRYRETLTPKEDGSLDFCYEKLKKTRISNGVNQESEIETISREDFLEIPGDHSVSKDRYIFSFEGKKFEVDQFYRMSLVIMEVEDVDPGEKINFPPFLEKLILMEVTGNPVFDNINLAK